MTPDGWASPWHANGPEVQFVNVNRTTTLVMPVYSPVPDAPVQRILGFLDIENVAPSAALVKPTASTPPVH
ncbi:MAG: hypothetical protein ACYDHT_06725 [Solirubrobacteraceae bacterium]